MGKCTGKMCFSKAVLNLRKGILLAIGIFYGSIYFADICKRLRKERGVPQLHKRRSTIINGWPMTKERRQWARRRLGEVGSGVRQSERVRVDRALLEDAKLKRKCKSAIMCIRL